MKIKVLYIGLLIAFSVKMYGQAENSGIVRYNYSIPHFVNTSVWEENNLLAELQFNFSESIFYYNKLSMLNGESEEAVLTPKGFGYKSLSADEDGYQYYRNFKLKKIFIRIPKTKPLAPLSVQDNWIEIDWQIEDSVKTILGYPCQKAVGYFRGRTYEVWFSKEIPLPHGPWKLFGLPGLILEAKDKKNQIKFLATEICYPCEPTVEIQKKIEKKHMDIQEYVEYKDYLMENVEKEFKSTIDSLKNVNKIDSSIDINLDNPTTKRDIKNKRKYMPEITYEWEEEKSIKRFKD